MPVSSDPSIFVPVPFIDALSHANSIETVISVAADWLPRLIPAARSSIGFLDGDKLINSVSRTDGMADPVFEKSRIWHLTWREKVLLAGTPVILDETAMRDARTEPLTKLLDSGIRSLAIAPMLGGEECVGTLSLGSREPDGISEDDALALVSFGRWIASQARLMQQARNTARLSETDTLTGLANRARLMRVLDGPGTLHKPDSEGNVIGVMHVDLDHFKQVNDTLGHGVGDAILRHAARAMQSTVSGKDLVARVGGDEFVIVTRTDPAGHHLANLATEITRAVSQPLRIGDVEARVGTSIGTAMSSGTVRSAERLIGNADIALYEVKRSGRGGVRAFAGEMRIACERRTRLLADLRDAVESRCFVPYFQPQVSMATGHFSGFEMLARWPHPSLGLIDPADFIELSAEAGLTDQIDSIVRAKGLAAIRQLRADGWDTPKMSFNASARTLGDPDLLDSLLWEVLQQGLAPEDLVVEVRETDLMAQGSEQAFTNINALSDAGFEVELDDFGSGYSAMSNLSRLSISAIKLDRSMISLLPDERAETVVRAIIAMAKELDLNVTAEGIETTAQYALIRGLGCDVAQGYGVSRPLPLHGLIAFMKGYGQAPIRLAEAHLCASQVGGVE
ncbi:MAG: EAL domain-containing protein [Rhodobacter sp.]|nr:EAL domain-containing protein [Rhodobacter sp.]